MIFFSVISGDPDQVYDAWQATVAGIARAAGVIDGMLKSHIASDRHWAVISYGGPDPIASRRLVMSPSGCVVVNGALTEFDGARGNDAIARLSDALQAEDIETVYPRMLGSFAVGGYLRQHGQFGFGDFSGVTPNYWGRRDGLTVIGNKPSIVALGLGETRVDPHALSWLVGHANLFGTATPLLGIHQIEPETLIRARRRRAPVVTALPTIWPGRDVMLTDDVPSADWDRITNDLLENTRACLSYFDAPVMALTGGKDSRLILALTSAVRDRAEIHTFTNGLPENPDVEVAAHVAKAFGVQHRTIVPKPATPQALATFWGRLASHCERFDSMVCPWDGLTNNLRGTSMSFTGFGGELFRGHNHARAMADIRNATVVQAQAAWQNFHQKFDPLSILRPNYATYQRNWLNEWVLNDPSHLYALPEKFYVFNRLGNNSGPLMEFAPGRIKLSPLLSRKAGQMMLTFNRDCRLAEMMNYEVTRRVAPELNRIPFMKQIWSPQVLAREAGLPDKPFVNSGAVNAVSVAPDKFRFLTDEADNIVSFLRRAGSETAMDEIFNVEGAVAAVQSGLALKSTINAKTIFSCVGIAYRLMHEGVPPEDRLHERAVAGRDGGSERARGGRPSGF